MFGAAKLHFLYHCSSFCTNGGSVLRTLLWQVPAWFILSAVSVFLHTLAVFLCFRVPTCPSLVLLSNTREVCSFHSLRKKTASCCTKVFAYLFRLIRWMLLQTPSPPPKHSAKSSHFPLNHQTGPMLSWTLSAIFFYFLFYFIIIFGLFIYLDNFEFLWGRRTAWALY